MKKILPAILLFLAFSARSSPGAEKPLHERIEEAIKKGVAYLKSCQKDDGSFGEVKGEGESYDGTIPEDEYHFKAGLCALALYALLKSGVKPDDLVIERGFSYIVNRDQVGKRTLSKGLSCYDLSLMILALEARHNPHKKENIRVTLDRARANAGGKRPIRPRPIVLPGRERAFMQEWVSRLVRKRSPDAWRYNRSGQGDTSDPFQQDMSSTQFALLALRAASHCHGIKFDRKILFKVVDFCLENQDKTGPKYDIPLETPRAGKSRSVISGMVRGFGYNKSSSVHQWSASTGTMTTAGCASLILCKELLQAYPLYRSQYKSKVDAAIRDGMAWIDAKWTMEGNPMDGPGGLYYYFYYYLYGLERVGDLLGTLKIGNHLWYNEGAEVLVEEQEENGAWERDDTHAPVEVINTSFALLFLDRATPPVVVTGK